MKLGVYFWAVFIDDNWCALFGCIFNQTLSVRLAVFIDETWCVLFGSIYR